MVKINKIHHINSVNVEDYLVSFDFFDVDGRLQIVATFNKHNDEGIYEEIFRIYNIFKTNIIETAAKIEKSIEEAYYIATDIIVRSRKSKHSPI